MTLDRSLKEIMEKHGVPKHSQRWCTRLFKLTPSRLLLEAHDLLNCVNLKGVQSHQSRARKNNYQKIGNKKFRDDLGLISQLSIYHDSKWENFRTMLSEGIPLNENTLRTNRHGCIGICPYAQKSYFKNITEKEIRDVKLLLYWGSKNRIRKYNFLKCNLNQFIEKGISREDLVIILSMFGRDHDFLGNKSRKIKGLKNKMIDFLTRIKKIDVRELSRKKQKEMFIKFGLTARGQRIFVKYLKNKFNSIEKNSDKGRYVKFFDLGI